ncbi:hypothetical protein G7046_g7052 [Stylonectria norvegica]|nr:hypothetical protein G7046_g7052 [Stylonectria norvegica]
MAPQLTADEIDDLIYFARTGEQGDLTAELEKLAEREKATPAEVLVAARDEAKSTCLHMATGNGHLQIVGQLLQYFETRPKEEKQAFLDEPNESGNTGLHWAALMGSLEAVKLLMDHGASPALANEQNYVPLDVALVNEKKEVADYFFSVSPGMEDEDPDSGLSVAVETVGLGEAEGEKEAKAKDAAS